MKSSQETPVLARSRFQLFIFEVPRLKPEELEASLVNRARALSPLHPGQYRLWLAFERTSGKTVAYVVLTKDDQPPFRLPVPLKAPPGVPQEAFVVVETEEGSLPLLYRGGVLRECGQAGLPSALEALHAEWGSAPWTNRSQLPPGPIPTQSVPRPRSPWVPLVVLALALGAASWSLVGHLQAKETRNAVWREWVKSHSPQAAVKKAGNLKELAKLAGVPVEAVFGGLGRAWPSGVTIRSFKLDGTRLSIQADTQGALGRFQALLGQPGFEKVVLVDIRRLTGTERMTVEGDWNFGD